MEWIALEDSGPPPTICEEAAGGLYPVRMLFWNLGSRPKEERAAVCADRRDRALAALVGELGPNVIVLVEDHLARNERSRWLLGHAGGDWVVPPLDNRIGIHLGLCGARVVPLEDCDGRYSVVALQLPNAQELLLVAAHLAARPWPGEIKQDEGCEDLADAIRRAERNRGHFRTILVGDLNVQPYESGMVRVRGLRAVMDERVLRRVKNTGEYPFFYNPMWSHYGDRSSGPPGTYYRGDGGQLLTYWYMLDQVLLRPELLDRVSGFHVEIVKAAGDHRLYRDDVGLIDESISDHLPVYCEFSVPTERSTSGEPGIQSVARYQRSGGHSGAGVAGASEAPQRADPRATGGGG